MAQHNYPQFDSGDDSEDLDPKAVARAAWVEQRSREKGDLELTEFEERAAKQQFEKWWRRQYGDS